MGGVQIKNCTGVPLKIQLRQVSVLYHGLVQPGECFIRDTGAVHFTIVAVVSDKDDTSLTDTVLPIVGVVGATALSMVTAGVAGVTLVPGFAIAGAASLVPGGIISEAVISVISSGISAAGGSLMSKELLMEVLGKAKKEHCYISSAGWYFGGKNELEIHGGPKILADEKTGLSYKGTPLRIVDANDPKRHS